MYDEEQGLDPMSDETAEREREIETKMLAVERMYTDYQEPGKEHVGIDPELKRGVAVFMAMGMYTDSSCWGHPERHDDETALYAEKNLLPYLEFTGYKPTDGLDDDGNPIGYSQTEVGSACERMKKDSTKLKELLDRFYKSREGGERLIELNYWEELDSPAAKLQTVNAQQIDDMPKEEQEALIAKARTQWSVFLHFVENLYKTGS